jgi:apolipoprotein N-acyltransferase
VVRASIGMGKADALEGLVPAANPPTLFGQWGHALTAAWAALFLILGLSLPRVLALARARG